MATIIIGICLKLSGGGGGGGGALFSTRKTS